MRAIVTGAASGIGLAAARRLNADSIARDGRAASLVLADLAGGQLEQAALDLRQAGAQVVTCVVDLADPRGRHLGEWTEKSWIAVFAVEGPAIFPVAVCRGV